MQTFTVRIEGSTPFLMHRFSEAAEADASTRRVASGSKALPRDAAEAVAYRTAAGELYFPSACISGVLCGAAGGHKLRGSRKSAAYVVPTAVFMTTDAILFRHPANNEPLTDFEVDSRPVVIPATKGRVMRHRPRLDLWAATFHLRINEAVLEPKFVHQLLTEGGQSFGIGDFRPQKRGPFGTFQVVAWAEQSLPIAQAAE